LKRKSGPVDLTNLDTEGSGSTVGYGELKKTITKLKCGSSWAVSFLSKPPLVRPFVIAFPRNSHHHDHHHHVPEGLGVFPVR